MAETQSELSSSDSSLFDLYQKDVEKATGQRGIMLVVEDDAALSRTIQSMFEFESISWDSLVFVHSRQEAIDFLQNHPEIWVRGAYLDWLLGRADAAPILDLLTFRARTMPLTLVYASAGSTVNPHIAQLEQASPELRLQLFYAQKPFNIDDVVIPISRAFDVRPDIV